MSAEILDQLVELRRFFRACRIPPYCDNGYVDLIEADVPLEQEDWEEVIWQLNDSLESNSEEKEVYCEIVRLEDGQQCLAYRTVGDICGAITRYKKGARKGTGLLRDYCGIALGDKLLEKSSPHAWSYAIFYWLRQDTAMKAESLNKVDLRWGHNEGPGEVEVWRLLLPDTAIRSSILAIDWLRRFLAEPLKSDTLEYDICRVLSDGRSLSRKLIQSELPGGAAPGYLKTTLSGLVKRQLLGKRPKRGGYFLTERGEIAFAAPQ
jgi:hypothetical protein